MDQSYPASPLRQPSVHIPLWIPIGAVQKKHINALPLLQSQRGEVLGVTHNGCQAAHFAMSQTLHVSC